MDAAPAEADGSRTVAYCNPIDGSPLTPTLDSRAIALKEAGHGQTPDDIQCRCHRAGWRRGQ